MQIKKFIAPTLKQATQQMKQELGSDAIILGSRILNGANEMRLFEVSAGFEEDEQPLELTGVSARLNSIAGKKTFSEEKEKFAEKFRMNILEKNIASLSEKQVKMEPVIKKSFVPPVKEEVDIERELNEVVDTLFSREVQKPIISSILNQLNKYKGFLNQSNIESYITSSIASLIPTFRFELQKPAHPKSKQKKPKVVALVGPTGVGKTTCIAKLAVISKILHNLDVGLISIDTYRLGALDQLRIFSEISSIDMLVAYESDEIPKLMNSFKKKDIIFIDTVGRSQRNKEQLQAANEFLAAAGADETYLVLSTTGTTKNLFDVAEKFKIFNYDSVIFTKIDEAVTFGNILNIVANFDVPVSFLSNGQVIPDDIISADPEFIANMIYTGKYN